MQAKRIASFRQLARVMDRIFFHRRKRPFFLLLFFGRAKKKKRNKLVGGVVGEGFGECLILQPRVIGGHLRNVAKSYSFDNIFSEIIHFSRGNKIGRVL